MKDMRKVLYGILGEDLTPGEVLRGARIDAGITQDELSEITQVARPNISALENGRLEMTSHYAVLFGVALNIHPAEILFPNGKFEKTEEMRKVEKRAAAILKKYAAG